MNNMYEILNKFNSVLTESKKPDFLDLDKDGDKKEPMKKAAADKDQKISEKFDPLKHVKNPTAGEKAAAKDVKRGSYADRAAILKSAEADGRLKGGKVKEGFSTVDEADVEEGNDFTGARQAAIKAGKSHFTVGGKTFKVTGDTSDEKKMDEGWDDMVRSVKNRDYVKVGDKWKTSKGEVEKTATGVVHRRAYDPKTGETDTGDDSPAAGEKRGRGRPKGTGKSIGAKGPSGKSKLLRKEDTVQESDEIANAKALLKKAGYTVSKGDKEDLDEKAVSKKQQRFMGMVHAAQKGEKPASKEVAKVAKSMGKKDAEDFAATKHKGLPEKKKKKEVEETTTAGSVATAPAANTKANSMFGKGVYEAKIAESFDNKLKTVLTEGMSVNMNVDADGKKSLTVTATDDDAVALSKLLSLAGIEGSAAETGMTAPAEPCGTCGSMDCACDHVDEALANSPDTQYSDVDTMINKLSGGLNGRKSTGQTTTPVVNRDPRRGSEGPIAESTEQRLWEIYNRYQVK